MLHFVKTGKRGLSDKVLYRLEQAEIRAGLRTERLPERNQDEAHHDRELLYARLLELQRRWHRRPSDHDQITLAIRILFPDHVREILTWLRSK